ISEPPAHSHLRPAARPCRPPRPCYFARQSPTAAHTRPPLTPAASQPRHPHPAASDAGCLSRCPWGAEGPPRRGPPHRAFQWVGWERERGASPARADHCSAARATVCSATAPPSTPCATSHLPSVRRLSADQPPRRGRRAETGCHAEACCTTPLSGLVGRGEGRYRIGGRPVPIRGGAQDLDFTGADTGHRCKGYKKKYPVFYGYSAFYSRPLRPA
ncbi:hypothetical protein BS78_01G443500, partial [Paspalum vaginatum]